MKYRVEQVFLGVHRHDNGTSEFVPLEPGTVFTIRGQVRGSFVDVIYRTRRLAVFVKDIQARAVKIQETGN
jgi:hypothetical protein